MGMPESDIDKAAPESIDRQTDRFHDLHLRALSQHRFGYVLIGDHDIPLADFAICSSIYL